METPDWQGRPVGVARTPSGVLAVVDYADNLIRVPGRPWPPAGPQADENGNFLPLPEWRPGQPRQLAPHAHPPREVMGEKARR